MKSFLSALLALVFLASPVSASVIKSTRPMFDKQYKPEGASLYECPKAPIVKTYFVWNGLYGATLTWTGSDEPVLWIWGSLEEIKGIVIRRGDSYFAIDMEELLSIAPSPCDLP